MSAWYVWNYEMEQFEPARPEDVGETWVQLEPFVEGQSHSNERGYALTFIPEEQSTCNQGHKLVFYPTPWAHEHRANGLQATCPECASSLMATLREIEGGHLE